VDGQADAPMAGLSEIADPAAFDALLSLCVQLGHEGREGKRVGILATLGDHEAVRASSRPIVLNPFHGHPESELSILNPAARRAIAEFSGMDGAFILRGDGVVLAGGRYLEEIAPRRAVPTGLGARHRAAAGITAATRCIAFTVSESTGDTRVFTGGHLVMTIERTD
jgi:diadenylate cyclase